MSFDWKWTRDYSGWLFGAVGFAIIVAQFLSGGPDHQLKFDSATKVILNDNPYNAKLIIDGGQIDPNIFDSMVWIEHTGSKVLLESDMRKDRSVAVNLQGRIISAKTVYANELIRDLKTEVLDGSMSIRFASIDPGGMILVRILWQGTERQFQNPTVNAVGISLKSLFFTSPNDIARISALAVAVVLSVFVGLAVTFIVWHRTQSRLNNLMNFLSGAVAGGICGSALFFGSLYYLVPREPVAFQEFKRSAIGQLK